MLYTILPDEMKRVENRMMAATGTSGMALMERAAEQVADASMLYLSGDGGLLAVCGAGNNGGDGLAAARILMTRLPRLRTTVWQLPGTLSAECAAQKERLSPFEDRLSVVPLDNGVPELPVGTACVIDAMFGTGLNRPLDGAALAAVERLNACNVPVVAVDIPSGLNGATGYPPEGGKAVVCADITVTFHRLKPGLLLGEGSDVCGRVSVADIGIGPEWDDAAGMAVLTKGDRLLPARTRNTHKGDYGRVLALVGSLGMAGAAGICATAALRAGAGLATVACPKEIVNTVQVLCPCATCLPLPEQDVDTAWQTLLPALERADALVAGCGLGREALAVGLMKRLFPWLCEHRLPTVLDADALNLLAERKGDFSDGETSPAAGGKLCFPDCVVLTPHLGEAARLLDWPTSRVKTSQAEAARALRSRYGGSVVLKSATSVLIGADGEAINPYGTPAMAKGGSGDALAGTMAALLAGRRAYGLRGVRLLQTACALHGLAGRLAAAEHGDRGMLATDLCEALGRVPDWVEEGGPGSATNRPEKREPSPKMNPDLIPGEPDEAPGKQADHLVPELIRLRAALGKRVRVTVDRPLGSRHPEHREIEYLLNYGYVADVLAADNEWQDAYVYGVTEPVEVFEGVVVAVIHRLNDVEDKWVVAAEDVKPTAEEICRQTAFAEQYFQSEIIM
ncbi:MAG: NAD(P)H-hydrate dehydratase [Eubacteriales bacterium]|nr:NAD(P)H-hydrate dehydratase [Eubacteriales bacterium]